MDAERIRQLIEHGLLAQGFADTAVAVSGPDGVHFEAQVISSAFVGKRALARHQLVYTTLGDLMGGAIHALALTTLTPDEHAAQAQITEGAR